MAGRYDKQAALYVDARPDYPAQWYSWFADRTPDHSLAWDVGTGNGQAALAVAEHYKQVIATDISEPQIQRAIPHSRVKYIHTPPSLSNEELISLIGSDNSFDLITIAQAVHWFDLPNLYAVVNRLLKKPDGLIAVWCYNGAVVNPDFDLVMDRVHKTTIPFCDPKVQYLSDGYKNLPFPFEGVGLGCEGEPMEVEIPKEVSFGAFLRMFKSRAAVVTAKEKGVDLLDESVVKEMESAWGGSNLVRSIVYKGFMLVGKVKM